MFIVKTLHILSTVNDIHVIIIQHNGFSWFLLFAENDEMWAKHRHEHIADVLRYILQTNYSKYVTVKLKITIFKTFYTCAMIILIILYCHLFKLFIVIIERSIHQ